MNHQQVLSRIALLAVLPFTLWSCKEKVTGFTTTPIIATDTTYMAAVESPQWHRVLIEEFTGVSCPPCPKGHQALESILAAHYNSTTSIDSVSIIGIQSTGIPQAEPVDEAPYHSRHDNRTADGSEIYNSVYGTFGSIPRAGIDRVPSNNILSIQRDLWASSVNDRLRVPAPVNMTISSTYDAGSHQAVIRVHVAYTADVPRKQNLNLAIIENDIIDAQKNDLKIDSEYHHQHVLRDMLTQPTGEGMMNDLSVKEAGRAYDRTFVYTVSNDWVPENCRLIAYITNNEGTDKQVQQAAEVSLK